MGEETQVDLLAQALLREYMHRKKFSNTLKTFDEENPRDENTVSSRAVMADLMHLSPERIAAMKSRDLETFMEILCADRVDKHEKLLAVARLRKELEQPIPPLESVDLQNDEQKKKKKKKKKLEDDSKADKPKLKKKAKLLDKEKSTMSLEELLETPAPVTAKDSRSNEEPKPSAPLLRPAKAKAPSESSNESSSSSEHSGSDAEEEAAAPDSLPMPTKRTGWSGDFTVDDPEETLGIAHTVSPAKTETSPQKHTPSHYGDDAIGMEEARRLRTLLVGPDRRIPDSFARQGFHFSPNVEYGIVQNEGGPCGVLASVQGYIIKELLSRSFITTAEALPATLSSALTNILMNVAGASKEVTVVLPATDVTSFTQESCRSVSNQLHVIASMIPVKSRDADAVRSSIDKCLPLWMQPDGTGMLCLILSAIYTRGGCDAVSRDMDVEAPLIVEHGYCSQELTNLILCGKAVSNVHDGILQSGSMSLRGFPSQLEVGFLSIFEAQKHLTVGDFAKKPKVPVWVVYNESHYTLLFSKERGKLLDRCLEKSGSPEAEEFDLFFWDQQGQEEEIRLSILCDPMPLPAMRKGQLIPFLNRIIRTMPYWELAKVDWNGTEPLL